MPDPCDILWAEDDDSDVFFIRRALKNSGISHGLQIARDGREAIEFLSATGRFSGGPRVKPQVVVTDLKMPLVDGLELAEWIRSNSLFENLPVVVVTSSDLSVDRERCARIGVNGYFLKPAAYKGWEGLMIELQRQWLKTNGGS